MEDLRSKRSARRKWRIGDATGECEFAAAYHHRENLNRCSKGRRAARENIGERVTKSLGFPPRVI